jgi:thioesterase domain-containing protein
MSLIFEAPTIATLALALADSSGWSALLPTQTGGSRPPLFVVHDGAGNIANGRSLAAELGPEQPIYGIRCEGLNGRPLHAESLEDLAGTYIERVRELYRDGPYVLYGASDGGTIAMEMARQLVSAGERVPLVILGDTFAPAGPKLSPRDRPRRKPLPREMPSGDGRALDLGEAVPLVEREMHVLRECGRLVSEYRPRTPVADRVVLLRTEGRGRSPDRGWHGVVGDALEIIDVPGSHYELCRETSSGYVGPVLALALDEYVNRGPDEVRAEPGGLLSRLVARLPEAEQWAREAEAKRMDRLATRVVRSALWRARQRRGASCRFGSGPTPRP